MHLTTIDGALVNSTCKIKKNLDSLLKGMDRSDALNNDEKHRNERVQWYKNIRALYY